MEDNKCFIYIIKDPLTNEIRYIGQTSQGKKRFRKHISNSNRKQPISCFIKGLLNKNLYPIFEIIHYCSIVELDLLEIKYIKEYKEQGYNLLNLTEGGKTIRGFKMPEHIKLKLSIQRKGIKVKEETKLKIKKNCKKWTQEERDKKAKEMIGENNPFYKKTHTEEVKKIISEYNKNRTPVNCKKILCLNNNIVYNSSYDAARQLNLKPSSIRSVLQGKAKTIKGYRFIYV